MSNENDPQVIMDGNIAHVTMTRLQWEAMQGSRSEAAKAHISTNTFKSLAAVTEKDGTRTYEGALVTVDMAAYEFGIMREFITRAIALDGKAARSLNIQTVLMELQETLAKVPENKYNNLKSATEHVGASFEIKAK